MQPGRATIEADAASQEDEEVVRVLDAYLAGLERGESVEPEMLLAQHPAIAHRLRSCLTGLQLVGGGPPTHPRDAIHIGEYSIECEIGRGGMGVVYEAVQRTTGRRVALKVLPFAASLDPRQLQRFKNESHAASHLHHPHIVPVYDVACAGGVHYYTMRLIAGESLATVWNRQRQSARSAARTVDIERSAETAASDGARRTHISGTALAALGAVLVALEMKPYPLPLRNQFTVPIGKKPHLSRCETPKRDAGARDSQFPLRLPP